MLQVDVGDPKSRVPEKVPVSFLDDHEVEVEVEDGARHHAHHGHDHAHNHGHANHAHGRAALRTAPLKIKVGVLESDMKVLGANISTLETMVGMEAEPAGDAAPAAAGAAAGAAAETVAEPVAEMALSATGQAPEVVDGTLKARITALESGLSDARSRVMSLNNEVLGGSAASGFNALQIKNHLFATGHAKSALANNLRERVNSMEDWVDHLKTQVWVVQKEVMGSGVPTPV